jgi:tRNA(Ile)-lysidine synthase
MSESDYPTQAAVTWPLLCQQFAEFFSPSVYGRSGIVVAVSGGADSVALARLLVACWSTATAADLTQLVIAHYNHSLRGADSDGDQQFVAELAGQLGVRFVTDQDSRSGTQAVAVTDEASLRSRRYEFLRRTMKTLGARCIVTAHNADDQVETILHHLFRGTGPVGMCGIPASRTIDHDFLLIRPLLGFRSASLRDGLRQIGQTWREDHTNVETQYRRNWIRGELLPLIRSRYHAVDEAIGRMSDSQRDWHRLIHDQAVQWVEQHVTIVGSQAIVQRGQVEPAVLGLAVSLIWDRMGWPRQSLGANHYRTITRLVNRSRVEGSTLPGAIRVTFVASDLVVFEPEPSRCVAEP